MTTLGKVALAVFLLFFAGVTAHVGLVLWARHSERAAWESFKDEHGCRPTLRTAEEVEWLCDGDTLLVVP